MPWGGKGGGEEGLGGEEDEEGRRNGREGGWEG